MKVFYENKLVDIVVIRDVKLKEYDFVIENSVLLTLSDTGHYINYKNQVTKYHFDLYGISDHIVSYSPRDRKSYALGYSDNDLQNGCSKVLLKNSYFESIEEATQKKRKNKLHNL